MRHAILAAAVNGASAVIEKSPNGVSKLLLRTGTFKSVSEAAGGCRESYVIGGFLLWQLPSKFHKVLRCHCLDNRELADAGTARGIPNNRYSGYIRRNFLE